MSFQFDGLFPIRLSMVNAVFDAFRSVIIGREQFDTGGTNGRDNGGIKGK